MRRKLDENGTNWEALARSVMARVDDPNLTGAPRSLANRIRETDSGRRPPTWWRERPAVTAALAAEVVAQVDEVERWYEATSAPSSSSKRLEVLSVLGPLDLDSPPPELWDQELSSWVEAVASGRANRSLAWRLTEPIVEGRWIIHRLRASDWRTAQDLDAGVRRANLGEKVVVLGDVDWSSAPALEDGSLLILSTIQAPIGAKPRGRRWDVANLLADSPTEHGGWRIIRNEPWSATLEAHRWFNDRVAVPVPWEKLERRLGADALASMSPSELLIWLNLVASGEDPVDAWTTNRDGGCTTALVEVERSALRDGVGLERTLEDWCHRLRGSEEDLLTTLQRAHKKGPRGAVDALLAREPRRLVERMLASGVLRPGIARETVRIWPSWCGSALRARAGELLIRDAKTLGEALLSTEADLASAALRELEDLVANEDTSGIRVALRNAAADNKLAVVEGLTLAAGACILDGRDLSNQVVEEIVTALLDTRGPDRDRWVRLLPHGNTSFSKTAMIMSEWAIGGRTWQTHPRFGPWTGATLTDDDREQLSNLEMSLRQWAEDGYDSEQPCVASQTLARRAVRLGSLLHQRRQVVPRGRPWFWSFQLPAILVSVVEGAMRLPGTSVADAFPDHVRLKQAVASAGPEDLLAAFGGALEIASREARADVVEHQTATAELLDEIGLNLALVREELEGRGIPMAQVLGWLWDRWNRPDGPHHRCPPVTLLRDRRLKDAKMVWRAAPPLVQDKIWSAADRRSELWEVLDDAQWVGWGRWAPRSSRGWSHIPAAALRELIGEPVAPEAYERAWKLVPTHMLDWIQRQLPTPPAALADGPLRIALTRTPSALCPSVIRMNAPDRWLQDVVEHRRDGWRLAWRVLAARREGTGSE